MCTSVYRGGNMQTVDRHAEQCAGSSSACFFLQKFEGKWFFIVSVAREEDVTGG